MEKVNTINYNPSGIDREKDFPVLLMRSGIQRYVYDGANYKGTPTKEQAPNGYTLFYNQGWHMVFDAVKTDKYVSLVRYYVRGSTYTWSSFRKTIEDNESILFKCGLSTWRESTSALKRFEHWLSIRFYPDNSIASIISFVNSQTKEVRSFQMDLNKLPSTEWDILIRTYINKLGIVLTEAETQELNNSYCRRTSLADIKDYEDIITEVWSEEDVKPQFLTKKMAKTAYVFLCSSNMDATYLYKENNVTRERSTLPAEWKKFFPKLFNDPTRYNIVYKEASESLNDHRIENQYSGKFTSEFYPSILFANVGISDSYLNRKTTTAETNKDIWDQYYDSDLDNRTSRASIRRIGDIIAISLNGKNGYWHAQPKLFIYDTKKKTRKMLNKYEDCIKCSPLTDSAICDFASHVLSRTGESYNSNASDTKTLIKGDLKEILAGSACGWILEAVKNNTLPKPESANHAYANFQSDWDYANRVYVYSGQSILQWAQGNPNSVVWFRTLVNILCREKLLLEQLAKCGLWHIFSLCILRSEWIAEKSTVSAKSGDTCLVYDNKSKSLTNSMGMRMDQLRFIDTALSTDNIITGPRHSNDIRRIDLCSALIALGISLKELKSMDLHTFERIVKISTDYKNEGYRGGSIASKLCYRWGGQKIKEMLQKMNPCSRKLNFIEKYLLVPNDNQYNTILDTFEDYLDMRAQLKNILTEGAKQNRQADIEELANFEKDWPMLPEAGTNFQRYVAGVRIAASRYGYDHAPTTEHEFKRDIMDKYPSTAITWVKDEDNRLLGVKLKLTAAERIQYNHDDLSIWLSTKKDKHNLEKFHQAYEQAKKLEYVSEKYGLRIVAPKFPQDLKREGDVLSHCVGSYVESVCQGKEKILFVRRNDMPYDPYFTIDVMPDGTVRQVHCYYNGDPTPEGIQNAYARSGQKVYAENRDILGFLTEWAKKTPGVKASSVQKHYGCLCAIRN